MLALRTRGSRKRKSSRSRKRETEEVAGFRKSCEDADRPPLIDTPLQIVSIEGTGSTGPWPVFAGSSLATGAGVWERGRPSEPGLGRSELAWRAARWRARSPQGTLLAACSNGPVGRRDVTTSGFPAPFVSVNSG